MRSAKIFQKVRSGSRQWENLEYLLLKKSVTFLKRKTTTSSVTLIVLSKNHNFNFFPVNTFQGKVF